MKGERYEHRFELCIRVAFQSVVRVAAPHKGAHDRSSGGDGLPCPQRRKHCPVRPIYVAIQLQAKQSYERKQAAVHDEFARVEVAKQ